MDYRPAIPSTFRAVVLCLVCLFSVLPATADLDTAATRYQDGVAAATIGEREQAFEDALAQYLTVYNEAQEAGGRNGLLCFNIGNCYYNLGQVGEAVYYYRTALALLPGNEQILGNLEVALQDRANAYDVESGGIHESILFFHYGWGMRQRVTVATWSGLLAALLLIGLILKSDLKALRYPFVIAAFVFACTGLSVAIGKYAPQRTGVLINKSEIRQGSGEGYAPILPTKIGEGSSLKVIAVKDGWFEVRLNDGRKGYIAASDLRLVL